MKSKDKSGSGKVERRDFVKGMGALGVAAAVTPLASCDSSNRGNVSEEKEPVTYTVYRFQTRKSRVCNACKNHARYKVFMSYEAADQNRAHQGCNCKIVDQTVTQEYMDKIELYVKQEVVDLRTAFGYG